MLIFINFLQRVQVPPADEGNPENEEAIDDPPPQGNHDETRGTASTGTVPQPSTARTRLFKSPLKNRKRVFRSSESSLQSIAVANEALSIMKDISDRRQEKDEYSLLGDQIALKIRKLPTEYAKIIVQHKINTIIFDAQMGRYNHPPEAQSYRYSHNTPYYSPFPIPPASPYSSISPPFSPHSNQTPHQYSYETQSHLSTSPSSSITTGDGPPNVSDNCDGPPNVSDNTDETLNDLLLNLN